MTRSRWRGQAGVAGLGLVVGFALFAVGVILFAWPTIYIGGKNTEASRVSSLSKDMPRANLGPVSASGDVAVGGSSPHKYGSFLISILHAGVAIGECHTPRLSISPAIVREDDRSLVGWGGRPGWFRWCFVDGPNTEKAEVVRDIHSGSSTGIRDFEPNHKTVSRARFALFPLNGVRGFRPQRIASETQPGSLLQLKRSLAVDECAAGGLGCAGGRVGSNSHFLELDYVNTQYSDRHGDTEGSDPAP